VVYLEGMQVKALKPRPRYTGACFESWNVCWERAISCREGQTLLRAGYEIALYRHWSDERGTLVPGAYEVEGYLPGTPG